MLNIDFMTEKEIIAIIRNPEQITKIINENVNCIYKGETQPLALWHLVERISPKNQDNDQVLSIPLISNLIKQHADNIIKNHSKKTSADFKKILDTVYIPLSNLINKLSIKRGSELVSTDNIKKLIFNEKIDINILYNMIIAIKKRSVLNEILKTANQQLSQFKTNQRAYQDIKKSINEGQQRAAKYSPSQIYFYQQLQSITTKEKNNNKKIEFYTLLSELLKHRISQTQHKREEELEEKSKQQSIEQYEPFLEDFISSTKRR